MALFVNFLASAGSSVLEAGKEVAKEVAIRGARSALGVENILLY